MDKLVQKIKVGKSELVTTLIQYTKKQHQNDAVSDQYSN